MADEQSDWGKDWDKRLQAAGGKLTDFVDVEALYAQNLENMAATYGQKQMSVTARKKELDSYSQKAQKDREQLDTEKAEYAKKKETFIEKVKKVDTLIAEKIAEVRTGLEADYAEKKTVLAKDYSEQKAALDKDMVALEEEKKRLQKWEDKLKADEAAAAQLYGQIRTMKATAEPKPDEQPSAEEAKPDYIKSVGKTSAASITEKLKAADGKVKQEIVYDKPKDPSVVSIGGSAKKAKKAAGEPGIRDMSETQPKPSYLPEKPSQSPKEPAVQPLKPQEQKPAEKAKDDEEGRVMRELAHLEGDMLPYQKDNDDYMAVVKDNLSDAHEFLKERDYRGVSESVASGRNALNEKIRLEKDRKFQTDMRAQNRTMAVMYANFWDERMGKHPELKAVPQKITDDGRVEVWLTEDEIQKYVRKAKKPAPVAKAKANKAARER